MKSLLILASVVLILASAVVLTMTALSRHLPPQSEIDKWKVAAFGEINEKTTIERIEYGSTFRRGGTRKLRQRDSDRDHTEIFIRVNSAWTELSQADFAMSKISVNETYGATFCARRSTTSVTCLSHRSFFLKSKRTTKPSPCGLAGKALLDMHKGSGREAHGQNRNSPCGIITQDNFRIHNLVASPLARGSRS